MVKRAATARWPNLGGFYATDSGVPVDLSLSVKWYEKAAERGNGRAAAVLGVMTLLGQGVEPDAEAAFRWFEQADELGFDWRPLAVASGLDLDDDEDEDYDEEEAD